MTVTSTSVTPEIYAANGSQYQFGYNFRVLASADMKVYLNGVLQNSGYIVTEVDDPAGGNVEFYDGQGNPNPPVVGTVVRLERVTPLDQQYQYTYPSTNHEKSLDKMTLILQELEYELSQLNESAISSVVDAAEAAITQAQILADTFQDISGLLQDISALQQDISALQQDVTAEASARASADTAHADLNVPHNARSAATPGRLICRDVAGRAQVAAPSAAGDIARKAEVDAVMDTLAANIAGMDVGAIGTYALLASTNYDSSIAVGSLYAGSGLRYAGFRVRAYTGNWDTVVSGGYGGTPSGTWRAMGGALAHDDPTYYPATLFLRVA